MTYFYTTVLCELEKHIFKAKHSRYFSSIVWLKDMVLRNLELSFKLFNQFLARGSQSWAFLFVWVFLFMQMKKNVY